jgi:hypothetical protein
MQNFRYQIIATRWFTACFLLALLIVQVAITSHASEHEFHEHTESCDVYQLAEKQQGNGLQASDVLVLVSVQHTPQSQFLVKDSVATTSRHFHQRAPPVS